ncbi:hypothetical protein GCM10007874_04230 [Labrys miyagiensis]|uniref:DUF982 domain-containing protein n=1 Tax=Labrys miyagiensis TaxID=346912 RepID=A0ABQ6CCK4_9HYPH|nr:DUF982 domain-containing protein [Labrys miyagiensis]GLS17408.1 hypothetical protein GCM10007874_04230 [Labrys miyagiensis]
MMTHPFIGAVLFARGMGLASHVGNAEAALYFLENKWPDGKRPRHDRARRICQRAMADEATTQEARDAFVHALAEADFDLLDTASFRTRRGKPRNH